MDLGSLRKEGSEAGAATLATATSDLPIWLDQQDKCAGRSPAYSVFFFFFFLGYRGIVHPPSADEGTERTWFEPEQRPRKRVPKRSVHGKQSPQGASKMSWRKYSVLTATSVL